MSPTPADPRKKPRYEPTEKERTEEEKNRRFGASLRKLYRESLDEPLSPELEETLKKLK
jgi:hypothetical protein